MMLQVHKME